MSVSPGVAILGSGIIGLSTAIVAADEGLEVTIYSRTDGVTYGPTDASDKGGSVWFPALLGGDASKVDVWASDSYEMFSELSRKPTSGVTATTEIELIDEVKSFQNPPKCVASINGFQATPSHLLGSRLPEATCGVWQFPTYIVSMPSYLPFLHDEAGSRGIRIVRRAFDSPEQVNDLTEPAIVNCTGLGAAKLFGDRTLTAVKGHLLSFDPVDFPMTIGRNEFLLVPRADALLLGVLYLKEFDSLAPQASDRDTILTEIHSWQQMDLLGLGLGRLDLTCDRIMDERCGLRPYRPGGVRLERDPASSKILIHNYGHGGSGVTTSWGCAIDAVQLLMGALR